MLQASLMHFYLRGLFIARGHIIVVNGDLVRVCSSRALLCRSHVISGNVLVYYERFEPAMEVSREPPLRLQCPQQTHHGWRAECAFSDVVAEIGLSSQEILQIPVVFDGLGPVVRQKDGRRR